MTSIHNDILRFIEDWDETLRHPAGAFGELAVRLFHFQYSHNEVYKNYCKAQGITPRSVRHWLEIPALPVSAFKDFPVTTVSPEQAAAVFHTSGTSYGGARKGKHYFATLRFYEKAAIKTFRAFCLPDLVFRPRIPFLVAFPVPYLLPHSSLSYMLQLLRESFGDEDSGYFVSDTPLWNDLSLRLESISGLRTPVFLVGSTLHLADFLQYLRSARIRFRLPSRSRVMDTGGSKSLDKALPRDRFLCDIEELLGIPPDFVVNEYGMTELTSQCYDGHILEGIGSSDSKVQTVGKLCPPWVRVVLVDPHSLEPAPGLSEGLIRVYDLANVDSVLAVQTEDVGTSLSSGGWDVLGRLPHSEPRGCSLVASDFLGTTRK